MKRAQLVPVAITCGALLLSVGVGIGKAFAGRRPVVAAPTPSAPPVAADAPAEADPIVAVLLPPQMANVAPRSDGRLVSVAVHVGQPVKTGTVLASFDARDRRHDLAQAEATLRQAQGAAAAAGADLAAARYKASRRNSTVEVNGAKIAIVSGEEATQSVLDARSAAGRAVSASGQVDEARARVAQLKLALEETDLRAPFDGVVTGVYFEPGTSAHAGETVIRVVGTGKGLRVRIAVPEQQYKTAVHASRAKLALDDGRTLMASIERLSPEVEPASRTFLAEGRVDMDADCTGCAVLAGRTVVAQLLTDGAR
jgi:RND family efflux transporter MFP subunit